MRIKCRKCGYEWDTSSEMSMVTCPNCEYKTPQTDEIQTPSKKTQQEVRSLTSGFPTKWIGGLVAAIVAVAGVALLYQGGESGSGPGYVSAAEGAFAAESSGSGIENIYLVKADANVDLSTALSAQEDKLLGTIEHDRDVVAIPPNTSFDIVVSVKASYEDFESETCSKENVRVSIGATGDKHIKKENVCKGELKPEDAMEVSEEEIDETTMRKTSIHLNVQRAEATNLELNSGDNCVINVDQYIQ